MLAAIDGAKKQVLFETYIWKGDEIGWKFKAALTAAADRGVDVHCIYDGFANLVVSPAFKRFSPAEGAALPGVDRGPEFLGPAPLRPRPPQDARGRRGGRLPRAATTSARPTRPSGATPTCGSPVPALGTSSGPSPTSGTSTAAHRIKRDERPLLLETASDWDPQIRIHRNIRGSGTSRSAACTSRRSTREPQHLDHDRLLPARPGLRRRAGRRGAARGRRPDPAAAEVEPHRRRLDLARLLRRAARLGRPDPALPRRDGARQDRHHRREVGDRRDGQHRPAQPARATTRSTSR